MTALPHPGLACRERRFSARYFIERELRYRTLGRGPELAGIGKTLNLSSFGILFTVQGPIRAGRKLELSINWPAEHGRALQLVIEGRIARCAAGEAALEIHRYQLRRAGSKGQGKPVGSGPQQPTA